MMKVSKKKSLLRLLYPFHKIKWQLFGKPDAVKVLLFHGEDVLMIQKSYKGGEWYLPGGFIEEGESPEKAAHREVLEELGIDAQHLVPGDSKHFHPTDKGFDLYTFVVDLKKAPVHIDGIEVEDAQWFSLHNLPETGEGQGAKDLLAAYYNAQN